jgi:plasmid stabilization system protein ParE
MKFRLRIRSVAREDLRSASAWYESHSPAVAHRFGEEVGATLSSVEEQPFLYRVVYRDIRRAMTRRFPYAIYFIVEGDRISVLRILHQARDPRAWQGKA